MRDQRSIIELQQVSFSREGQRILEDIDLAVRKSETLAIIGPTGSGKTTILRIMDLLERPTRGKVFFEGRDASCLNGERVKMRRRMAMVFQRPAMFSGTVRDNVAYGIRVRGLEWTVVDEMVDRALTEVGLHDYRNRYARTLSGGEIQRVALARALATEPEVLLLDEPTANLDPRTVAAMEVLIQRRRDSGLAVVLSTHDLGQSIRLSDRIAVIIEGRLAQVGSAEDVFNAPTSRDVEAFLQGWRGAGRPAKRVGAAGELDSE